MKLPRITWGRIAKEKTGMVGAYPCPFSSAYQINSKGFESWTRESWWNDNIPPLKLSIRRERLRSALLPTTADAVHTFWFDTGASRTVLTAHTAKELNLNMTWKYWHELWDAKLADDAVFVEVHRTFYLYIGQQWVEVEAHVPIEDQTQWWMACQARLGLHSKVRRTQHIGPNLLGITDVIKFFLPCVAHDGLYLFPRKP